VSSFGRNDESFVRIERTGNGNRRSFFAQDDKYFTRTNHKKASSYDPFQVYSLGGKEIERKRPEAWEGFRL
jgi:hypothetical protein